MPIPASLIASIVSAIIESAVQNYGATPAQYDTYVVSRTLPPEAKLGVMQPPIGDGNLIIDGTSRPLAPTAQFRSQKNLIVMPMSIQASSEIVYIANADDAIHRVWMISSDEATAQAKKQKD